MWGVLGLAVLAAPVRVGAPEGCEVDALTRIEVPVTGTASVTAEDGGFAGRITLGAFPARTVTGADCEEVVAALALIAGLAAERLPPEPSPPEPPAIPPRPSPPLERAALRAVAPAPLFTSPRWRLFAGLQGGAVYGVAPSVAATAPLFVELTRDTLALRGSLIWATARTEALDSVQAGVRLEACPLHVVLGQIELDPCVGVELGVLRGRARKGAVLEEAAGFWAAPAGAVHLKWRGLHPFFFELTGGASVPLLRHRFFLAPDVTLFETPAVAAFGGLGAGVAIW